MKMYSKKQTSVPKPQCHYSLFSWYS